MPPPGFWRPFLTGFREMVEISGTLARITFQNPENHYTVARLTVDETQGAITLVGHLAGVKAGETLKVQGRWESHPRFGQQLFVNSFEVCLPTRLDAIRRYLTSGLVKGLGPKMVARIIETFGEDTLDVMDSGAEKLTKVKGIGTKTARRIAEAWQAQHAVRRVTQFLQEHGVDPKYSGPILKLYGEAAVMKLEEDPYQLAEDLPGVGFRIADAIAVSRGTAPDDPARLRSCLLHTTGVIARDGHTCVAHADLVRQCHRLFKVDEDAVRYALNQILGSEDLVAEPDATGRDFLYLPLLHQAEKGIARRMMTLRSIPLALPGMASGQIAAEIVARLAIELSGEQKTILEAILKNRVAILTGGPGTGKTTLIRSLTAVYEASGLSVALTAPTGRAAKQLADISDHDAVTIHRLLHYNQHAGLFDKNRDEPLDTDVIIVDEASMVDTLLMYHLLEAVHMQTILILVGDTFQLPPVGPGNVLADLIGSGQVATFTLTRIFRQMNSSLIVTNAHRIRQGDTPEIPNGKSDEVNEFYFLEALTAEAAARKIVSLCQTHIPNRFGLDAMRDIQVLTPMHKGAAGTMSLNLRLQQALNTRMQSGGEKGLGHFRLNDKVMHLRNNYTKGVFNGDIGAVCAVDLKEALLTVDYDGRQVAYDATDISELTLAYAISVHKSQGSEYPAVVLALLPQHYRLLQRNLLYTAVTRGKKLVIIVGSRRALQTALDNNRSQQRITGLKRRLTALAS